MPPREQRFHSFSGTSLGNVQMGQHWVDLILWEAVLNGNPQVTGIVEIGTFQGGFSFYLDMQSRARGFQPFVTFDVIPPKRDDIPGFEQLDVFRYADALGERLKAKGPIVLLCDGGNKPREVRTFAPVLADGSVVVAHDWGAEMLQTDVPDFLEELYGDYCDEIGSISRVFRMKETG